MNEKIERWDRWDTRLPNPKDQQRAIDLFQRSGAETKFVGQRHTLPISRNDTIEVSTLVGCLLRDFSSMYYSRLQSYGEFSNISLSMVFTLFPRISLHFIGVI